MLKVTYEHFVGAIYDVDDTLLSNHPDDGDASNLHERSRLAATHAIGAELGLDTLLTVTLEENFKYFQEAPQHTVDSAVWTMLYQKKLVDSPMIDYDHPLLRAIVERKAELHIDLLKTAGKEVPGASAFVRGLEQNGLAGKQAIASGARLEEIRTFLNMYQISDIFPRRRIIARGDYQHAKPDPDPYHRAFKTLGLADTPKVRSHVLAVEDDPKGYLSALNAGLYVCVVTTMFPPEAFIAIQRPQYIATDMAELGEILEVPFA
jgi:beta-phosphoglucomutase-like phosphatase (HAD superfamily)